MPLVTLFRRPILTLCACLLSQAALANEPQVSFRRTEKVIPAEPVLPLVLQVGTDYGYLNHTTTIDGEGPFTGSLLTGKALAAFVFDDWIMEGGAGWSYSALYGKTRSENPAEPALGHRVYTQSGFVEAGLRYRLTPKFNFGLIAQDYFGTDLTLSQRKDLVKNMFLGGMMMAVDLLSDSGIFRLGATFMTEIPDNQRQVQIYGVTAQFGIPLRGYDTLLRKTDVVVRTETIKKVEVPKIVTRTIVRDVSKYSLPRETFHFARGQSFLAPEDQSFIIEFSNTLKQLQAYYKTVTIEAQIRTTGDAKRDQRLSEQRAQSIRNALVSTGLSPQRVLAAGQGGRPGIEERPSSKSSITLIDLSFAGLTQPDAVSDALNDLFRRRITPETCQGDKCK